MTFLTSAWHQLNFFSERGILYIVLSLPIHSHLIPAHHFRKILWNKHSNARNLVFCMQSGGCPVDWSWKTHSKWLIDLPFFDPPLMWSSQIDMSWITVYRSMFTGPPGAIWSLHLHDLENERLGTQEMQVFADDFPFQRGDFQVPAVSFREEVHIVDSLIPVHQIVMGFWWFPVICIVNILMGFFRDKHDQCWFRWASHPACVFVAKVLILICSLHAKLAAQGAFHLLCCALIYGWNPSYERKVSFKTHRIHGTGIFTYIWLIFFHDTCR